MSLPLGKLNPAILQEIILKQVKTHDSVLNPPAIGEDGAVFTTRGNIVIAASDPITGIEKKDKLGRLSVHVNANDVWVHAASPKWYFTTLLLPQKEKRETLEKIMQGIKQTLSEINAYLIGGHTELTKKVTHPIIAGFMLGEPMVSSKFVRSRGGKVGDRLIMTKSAGIEGTYILANDFEKKLDLPSSLIKRAKNFEHFISIMSEVRTLVNEIGIESLHAMHDATEGGVLGATYELTVASETGFELWREYVNVREETKHICSTLDIDPLKLISSGTLIAALPKDKAEQAVSILQKEGICASIVGKITKNERYVIEEDRKTRVNKAPVDEIWKLLEKA